MTLRDIFKVIDSESVVEIINVSTGTQLIKGIRGMVDMACMELDWEVTHIIPDNTTKIWVKRPNVDSMEDF
jgi:hypothetical protein